jgi:hypothetical protein
MQVRASLVMMCNGERMIIIPYLQMAARLT